MKDIHDVSLIRPAAISDLRYSPKGPITGEIVTVLSRVNFKVLIVRKEYCYSKRIKN